MKKTKTPLFTGLEPQEVDILGLGVGHISDEQRKSVGVFVKQTRTVLVHGRIYYKIINRYGPTTKDPIGHAWGEENYPKDLTTLEALYKEFCKKAYSHIACHGSLNGSNMPSQIIFPDFQYEIIPTKLPIE